MTVDNPPDDPPRNEPPNPPAPPSPPEPPNPPDPTPPVAPPSNPPASNNDRMDRLEQTLTGLVDTVAKLIPNDDPPHKRPWTHIGSKR